MFVVSSDLEFILWFGIKFVSGTKQNLFLAPNEIYFWLELKCILWLGIKFIFSFPEQFIFCFTIKFIFVAGKEYLAKYLNPHVLTKVFSHFSRFAGRT